MLKIQTRQLLLFHFVSLLFFSCNQTKRSELSDPPCVIVIPESNYYVIGQKYSAEIILNCDKPKNVNQIDAVISCQTQTDSDKSVISENNTHFSIVDGRLFCSFEVNKIGKNTLAGKLMIKMQSGDTITHSFEYSFYSMAPDVVISANKFNYLVFGEENAISVGAPGFTSKDLIVKTTNADLKKISTSNYIYYSVKPNSFNDVKISAFIKHHDSNIPLGTLTMKVIDKFPK